LILGVSARAAAASAVRAGFQPLAADCFRDRDLAATCDCVRIDHYPADLEQAASTFPVCPWLYTGGLENHPQLLDRIAQQRPLLGNAGGVLREARDPFCLAGALREAGLPALDVSAVPLAGGRERWLKKPRKSGGGQRVEFVAESATESGERAAGEVFYYQRYVAGTPVSAIFLAADGRAICCGATRQLIGSDWTGARGFEYAGSVGPLDLTAGQRAQWQSIGDCLARRFALSGLFGVDAVEREGSLWTVELNPRYTASVEVVELACDTALLPGHVSACESGQLPSAGRLVARRRVGKVIVYAGQAGRVPLDFDAWVCRRNADGPWPTVADIPAADATFQAGEPLVTVLAYGESLDGVEQALRNSTAAARAALGLC